MCNFLLPLKIYFNTHFETLITLLLTLLQIEEGQAGLEAVFQVPIRTRGQRFEPRRRQYFKTTA